LRRLVHIPPFELRELVYSHLDYQDFKGTYIIPRSYLTHVHGHPLMPSELYFYPSIVGFHLAPEIVGMFYRTTTFSIYESSSLVSFMNTPNLPVNIAVKHLIRHYKVRLTGEEEDLEILQTLKEVTVEYVRVTITKP
jgi:hypothetical protein